MSNIEPWRARLREAVKRSGRKQYLIAEDAGICPTTLSRVLSGEVKRPSFVIAAGIAHAAGESVGWILGEPPYRFSAEERARLRDAAAIIIACRYPSPLCTFLLMRSGFVKGIISKNIEGMDAPP